MRTALLPILLIASTGFGACRKTIPSEPPPPAAADDTATASPLVEAAAVPRGECLNEDFSSCEYACRDIECFEWCAGAGCTYALREVVGCIEPALSVLVDADRLDEEGHYAQADAAFAAFDSVWLDTCAPRCQELVSDRCDGGICEDDWCLAGPRVGAEEELLRLVEPPPAPGVLGISTGLAADVGVLGAFGGSRLTLLDVDAADPRQRVVSRLVASDTALAREAAECVSDSSKPSPRFVMSVTLGAQGRAQAVQVERADLESASACIRERMLSLRLPSRVAKAYAHLRLELTARPELDNAGVLGVLDSSAGIESFEGWGSGGLGLHGTGRGGGGTAEGIGGLGTVGVGKPSKAPADKQPTAAEKRARKKLEAACQNLAVQPQNPTCKALAAPAKAVYENLPAAGNAIVGMPLLTECLERLTDETLRCVSDPAFRKMIESMSKPPKGGGQ